MPQSKYIALPQWIVTRRDVMHLARAVESFDEESNSAILQKISPPVQSRSIVEIFKLNSMDSTKPDQRQAIKKELQKIVSTAPLVSLAFASEPSGSLLERLVDWLRKESGTLVLLSYRIQPTIAGGCVLQTPIHQYDFSLRKYLKQSEDVFLERLHQVAGRKDFNGN